MWSLWIGTLALGRTIVHEGRPATPPEAWYMLERPISCAVAVGVGADGRPREARPRACPEVLHPALAEAALRWRWAPAARVSTEVIEVSVRPPQFSPPSDRDDCVVGYEIRGQRPVLLADVPRRCAITTDAAPEVAFGSRVATAWCQLTVSADAGGVRGIQLGACADGFESAAADAVRNWTYHTDRPRRWTILMGFQGPEELSFH